MKNPAVGALIQRLLFSGFFIWVGVDQVMHWQESVSATGAVYGYGPGAIVFSALWVALVMGGGLSILFGKMTNMGGWMLTVFLLGGAYIHYTLSHQAFSGSEQHIQMTHAIKNLALMGVALRYALGGSVKS